MSGVKFEKFGGGYIETEAIFGSWEYEDQEWKCSIIAPGLAGDGTVIHGEIWIEPKTSVLLPGALQSGTDLWFAALAFLAKLTSELEARPA